jgi:hypothetical protein
MIYFVFQATADAKARFASGYGSHVAANASADVAAACGRRTTAPPATRVVAGSRVPPECRNIRTGSGRLRRQAAVDFAAAFAAAQSGERS